jgi:hypothetical protein
MPNFGVPQYAQPALMTTTVAHHYCYCRWWSELIGERGLAEWGTALSERRGASSGPWWRVIAAQCRAALKGHLIRFAGSFWLEWQHPSS